MRLPGALLFTLAPGPALAEVCDKVVPGWNSSDGSVSLVGGTLHYLSLYPSMVIGAAFAVSLLLRYRWCWVITLALSALWLGVEWIAWTDTSPGSAGAIMRAAISEGCLSKPYLYVALLFGVLGYSVYGVVRGRIWTVEHRAS